MTQRACPRRSRCGAGRMPSPRSPRQQHAGVRREGDADLVVPGRSGARQSGSILAAADHARGRRSSHDAVDRSSRRDSRCRRSRPAGRWRRPGGSVEVDAASSPGAPRSQPPGLRPPAQAALDGSARAPAVGRDADGRVRPSLTFPSNRLIVADEVGDETRFGLLVDLARRADLDELAVVHHRDAVGHRHRLFLVVRDDRRR